MSKKHDDKPDLRMLAFLFDSGKIGSMLYGEKVFGFLVQGGELSTNAAKIVVSEGDILQREVFDDITPFVIRDELCTVKTMDKKCSNIPYAVLMEDITADNAKKIDGRLWQECPGYLGMTSVDVNSADERKQFWKWLIRSYSIEMGTITCFGCEEEGFAYDEAAERYGFQVNYDGFSEEENYDDRQLLFSTRRSGFITRLDQLEIKKGRNDSDRGILEMNYSLVREVEIAGVQIWKAIEDIDRVSIPKSGSSVIVDYLFTSLYQAAQGIERLLKIVIELMVYRDEPTDRQRVDGLLMGHNYPGMYHFILERRQKPPFGKQERKLIDLLSEFYNDARYVRFRYNEDHIMELNLFQEFGRDLEEDTFDDRVKHRYGKALGTAAHRLYRLIFNLSRELNIYVYELNSESVANFSLNDYYKDDLYGLFKDVENSKRELLWYALTKGKELRITAAGREFEALPFEEEGPQQVFEELIRNRNSGRSIYEFVSPQYDDLVDEDKEKWKERLRFIGLVGNSRVYWAEDVWDEEEWEEEEWEEEENEEPMASSGNV